MSDIRPPAPESTDRLAARNEGGLWPPPGLSFWRKAWWWFHFLILIKLARLRFIAILAAIGAARPLVATLYQARRAAISRMTAECAALGALGVIGVQLTVGPFGDDEDILEFKALGTAVRARGVTSRAQPFASDLSGQDFTKLVAHGWVPVGLAMGVAVSLAASLATDSFAIQHFNRVSLYGVPSNLLMEPLSTFVIMPFLAAGALLRRTGGAA